MKLFYRKILPLLLATPFSCLALPSWVTSIEADNQQTIFGVASGVTIEEAKRNALLDIAGKFNHQVEERLHHQLEQVNGSNNKRLLLETRSQITPLDLSHYQYDRIESEGSLIWVRAALERVPYSAEKKTIWQTQDAKLAPWFSKYQSARWGLLHAVNYQLLADSLKQQWKTLNQLSVLGLTADNADIQRYIAYQNSMTQTDRFVAIALYGESNSQELSMATEKLSSLKLQSSIVDEIPLEGIQVTSQSKCKQDNRNAYLCEYKISLTSTTEQGSILGYAEFQAKGRDYDSEHTAREKAFTSLKINWQRMSLRQWLNIGSSSHLSL